jgi:D-3-phosphoglycerate dehydrogenase
VTPRFRVGISADLRGADGTPIFGHAPLSQLDAPDIGWEWLPPRDRIGPEEVAGHDALYINTPLVPVDAFAAGAGRLLVIARHGVGYDSVDVAACTAAGVLVTIQPDGVRRPLAVAALTLVLALSQRLLIKDRLTRSGGWARRTDHMGDGLTGRTLGVVGAGNVGKELLGLARPFFGRVLACDPYVDPAVIIGCGAAPADFPTLLAESDFVVLLVPLDATTRHLVGAAELARMKPTACLVNVARGPVVEEAALIAALQSGRLAGAALDVFAQEPVAPDNPLLAMPQVIVTPHSLCWTDECFAGIAESGLRSIRAVLAGEVPANAVNPAAGQRRIRR